MSPQRPDRHGQRLREIAEILARHGLGYLVGVVGLERFVPFHRGLLGHPVRELPYTRPEHVRMALEQLGAAWIKLGQVLSTRADLLPPAYQAELGKLQDAAPPVPLEQIRAVLQEELGRPIDEVFAAFEPQPLAAASIGQAHAATMPDGSHVVVKVRRPGVVEQVEEDLEILLNLAAAASRRWAQADAYDVVGLAQEFGQALRAELDYISEARNAERFARSFARDPEIHIPRVFWEATTSRVLTLERVFGVKISDLPALDAMDIDRRALAERAARVLLQMVFEDGFFHADPHPGNFFVEPNGRIGLIDFGLVGAVDDQTQQALTRLLVAVTSQNADRLVDAFLELGVARQRVERALLRRDLEHLLGRYYGRQLGEVALGPLLEEAFGIVRRHRLHLPPNLVLLLKTVAMSEGLAAQLDPQFRIATILAPYAERLVLRQYSPLAWARRFGQASLDLGQLSVELPQQLRRILRELEHGGLEVGMRPVGLDSLAQRLERAANRLVLGMLVAAAMVSLAVLMTAFHPPGWEQASGRVFAGGLGAAVVIGVYLAVSVLRSSRP